MNATSTLLIIDDVPANVGVIADSMDGKGFRVLVAQDGLEGLERAERALPDLILLDVMMPGMDGFEVCRRLKASPATCDIPVIFMTALADRTNKLAGFEAGGVDYVTKPFDTTEVLARINTHLALRTLQRQLTEQNRQLQQTCDALKETNHRLQTAQAQLLQSEKMASIGVLAAGVAHEINNPLGFIGSNLKNLEEYITQVLSVLSLYESGNSALQQADPELLAAIRHASEEAELDYIKADLAPLISESKDGMLRVKKIVQDLKDFSHVGESEWQFADLNQGLDNTLNIVAHELKYKATVCKEYGDLPAVECMPMELNQVFMNLLVNAAHAIPRQGEIRIRTGVSGEEVWIEIADTGTGIAQENLTRIFDPFFTTKPVGQGTGLGLSLSYATVKKHAGRIDVQSARGQGTSFRVSLPIYRPKPANSPIPLATPAA